MMSHADFSSISFQTFHKMADLFPCLQIRPQVHQFFLIFINPPDDSFAVPRRKRTRQLFRRIDGKTGCVVVLSVIDV